MPSNTALNVDAVNETSPNLVVIIVSEDIEPSETLQNQFGSVQIASDILTLVQSSVKSFLLGRNVFESNFISDVTVRANALLRVYLEDLQLVENVTQSFSNIRVYSETLELIDNLQISVLGKVRLVSETIETVEALDYIVEILKIVEDTLQALETVGKDVLISVESVDTLEISNTVNRSIDIGILVNEVLSLLENTVRFAKLTRQINETLEGVYIGQVAQGKVVSVIDLLNVPEFRDILALNVQVYSEVLQIAFSSLLIRTTVIQVLEFNQISEEPLSILERLLIKIVNSAMSIEENLELAEVKLRRFGAKIAVAPRFISRILFRR